MIHIDDIAKTRSDMIQGLLDTPLADWSAYRGEQGIAQWVPKHGGCVTRAIPLYLPDAGRRWKP